MLTIETFLTIFDVDVSPWPLSAGPFCNPLRLGRKEKTPPKKGKDTHPQDKIQHLGFAKDPRPLYYKTPPCAFYHKNVRSKAVFGP